MSAKEPKTSRELLGEWAIWARPPKTASTTSFMDAIASVRNAEEHIQKLEAENAELRAKLENHYRAHRNLTRRTKGV
jgi:hypothetical protein